MLRQRDDIRPQRDARHLAVQALHPVGGALLRVRRVFGSLSSEYSRHTSAITLTGSGNTVLDIGCGKDFLAAEMTRIGNCVTGIDTLASGEVLPSLERYLQMNLEKGIANPGRFDLVLLLDVLEHMKTPDRLLEECKAALKSNGLLVVSLQIRL